MNCNICLQEINDKYVDVCVCTNFHYHDKCIIKWIKTKTTNKNTCEVCKSNYINILRDKRYYKCYYLSIFISISLFISNIVLIALFLYNKNANVKVLTDKWFIPIFVLTFLDFLYNILFITVCITTNKKDFIYYNYSITKYKYIKQIEIG
jgi:archaellum biogenesis protein FlaJ (TadC family)